MDDKRYRLIGLLIHQFVQRDLVHHSNLLHVAQQ